MFSRTIRRQKSKKPKAVILDENNMLTNNPERYYKKNPALDDLKAPTKNSSGFLSTLRRKNKKAKTPEPLTSEFGVPSEGDQEQYDLFHRMNENGYDKRTIEITMRKAGLDPTIVLGEANFTSTAYNQSTLKGREPLVRIPSRNNFHQPTSPTTKQTFARTNQATFSRKGSSRNIKKASEQKSALSRQASFNSISSAQEGLGFDQPADYSRMSTSSKGTLGRNKVFLARNERESTQMTSAPSYANFSDDVGYNKTYQPPSVQQYPSRYAYGNPQIQSMQNRGLKKISSQLSMSGSQPSRTRLGSSFSMMEVDTTTPPVPDAFAPRHGSYSNGNVRESQNSPGAMHSNIRKKRRSPVKMVRAPSSGNDLSSSQVNLQDEVKESLTRLDPQRFQKKKPAATNSQKQLPPQAGHLRYKIKYQPNPLSDLNASSLSMDNSTVGQNNSFKYQGYYSDRFTHQYPPATNVSAGTNTQGGRRPLSDRPAPKGTRIGSLPLSVPKDALSYRYRVDGTKLKILNFDSPVYYQYKLMQIDNLEVDLIVRSLLAAELDPVVLYPRYWEVDGNTDILSQEENEWEQRYSKRYFSNYYLNKRTGEVLWRENGNERTGSQTTRLSKMTDFGELGFDEF
eukprot:maker-scaffold_56-augustus-gene-1.58-mRNA-1 protein AED:0.00 eAED:0.00 QI:188/1/1/1/1/1/2/304/623